MDRSLPASSENTSLLDSDIQDANSTVQISQNIPMNNNSRAVPPADPVQGELQDGHMTRFQRLLYFSRDFMDVSLLASNIKQLKTEYEFRDIQPYFEVVLPIIIGSIFLQVICFITHLMLDSTIRKIPGDEKKIQRLTYVTVGISGFIIIANIVICTLGI